MPGDAQAVLTAVLFLFFLVMVPVSYVFVRRAVWLFAAGAIILLFVGALIAGREEQPPIGPPRSF